MPFRWALIVILLALCRPPAAWAAEGAPKLALLIGNQQYRPPLGALSRPSADVAKLGAALRELGFRVTIRQDLDSTELTAALTRFGALLSAAGPDAVGWLYLTGHGAVVEMDGAARNYFLPARTEVRGPREVVEDGVRLDIEVDGLVRTGAASVVVVHDVVRNAFMRGNQGFANESARDGVLLALSTVSSDVPDAGALAMALHAELTDPEGKYLEEALERASRRAGEGRTWDGEPVIVGGLAEPVCLEACDLADTGDPTESTGATPRRAPEPAPATGSTAGPLRLSSGERLVHVRGGPFTMGSPPTEPRRDSDEIQHQVTVSDLYVMVEEVSQGLWQQVLGESPSHFHACGAECPVESVSWHDAVRFANALSRREGYRPAYRIDGFDVRWDRSSDGFRLLTEAEWEYVARGGEPYYFSGADRWPVVGWLGDATAGPQPGCRKRPNAFGVCDMTGNVSEWVWDWFAPYPQRALVDPVGPPNGIERVGRGGAHGDDPGHARVAYRNWFAPAGRYPTLGVRLARSAP